MDMGIIVMIFLMAVVVIGGTIVALYFVQIKSVDGACQRLEADAEAARIKEAELSSQIIKNNEELQKQRAELNEIQSKMIGDIEAEAAAEKEKIINKAREEAEEIINKAQKNADNIRREIEKTNELRVIGYANKVIDEVFSDYAKGVLNKQLIAEFIEKLKSVDMSRMSANITTAEIITTEPLAHEDQNSIGETFKSKLNRDIQLSNRCEPEILGGVVLQFDTLRLDGSLKNTFKEKTIALKVAVEKDLV